MYGNKLGHVMASKGSGDVTILPAEPHMLDVLQGFVHELRTAGLPVSMTENLDAMRAIEFVPLDDRASFKAALGATLVKNAGHYRVFDTVFEVFFSMFSPGVNADGESDLDAEAQANFDELRAAMDQGGAMSQVSNEELAQMLLDALMRMDQNEMRMLAGAAVARFAGMEPGRPVGGAYYLYRTLRQLDADGLVTKMMARAQEERADRRRLVRRAPRPRRLRGPAQGAEGDDRGRDPAPPRRRSRRRGDGAHAAQAAARRRRLHARVARRDADAAAGHLSA